MDAYSEIQAIKSSVTVPMVLERFGFPIKRRIACPIHHGKDANFEVRQDHWICYSRCGCGDVIDLWQRLTGQSLSDSMDSMDAEFGLGLSGGGLRARARAAKAAKRASEAKREVQRRHKTWRKLMQEYMVADCFVQSLSPETPENLNEEYMKWLVQRELASVRLDELGENQT